MNVDKLIEQARALIDTAKRIALSRHENARVITCAWTGIYYKVTLATPSATTTIEEIVRTSEVEEWRKS